MPTPTAATTYALTGQLSDIAGGNLVSAKGLRGVIDPWQDGLTDSYANETRLGTFPLSFDSAGNWTVAGLPATGDGQGWVPAVQRLRVSIDYLDPGTGASTNWTSQWFLLTADSRFADVIFDVEVNAPNDVFTARDEAVAAATSAGQSATQAAASAQLAHDLSNIDTTDDAVAFSVAHGPATQGALSGTIVGQTSEIGTAALMVARGSSDQAASLARSQVSWSDASNFTESWANLSAWSPSASSRAQVSGGRLFSKGAGGSAGINHAIGSGVVREVVPVHYKDTNASVGGLIVGFSTDQAGADAAAGAASMVGLYLVDRTIQVWNKGNSSASKGIPNADTDFIYTCVRDTTTGFISVVARTADGTQEYSAVFSEAAVGTVNNLSIFNSDTRQLSGSSVGPLAARGATVTQNPRIGLEDVTATVHRTYLPLASGAANVRLATPTIWDSRKPLRTVVCWHGNGGNESTWAPPTGPSNANQYLQAYDLLANGFAVLSVGWTNPSGWFSTGEIAAYEAGLAWAKSLYPIGPIGFCANSMGGGGSLVALSQRRIPGIQAWMGQSPAINLAAAYADPTYTGLIRTAYGFSNDAGYAAATAGHDPALLDALAFRQVPMYFLYADDDTSIPPAQHSIPFIAKVTPVCPDLTVKEASSGGHAFDLTPYRTDMIAFWNRTLGTAS